MKKIKRHEKINPYDPYEDFVKLDKLDDFEAQIKSSFLLKKIKSPLNNISFYCSLDF